MQQQIINLLKKHTKLKDINLETPPSPDLGDYAFPCFQLAKKEKKNPIEIAASLAKQIKPIKGIEKIQPAGPYLNFFLDKSIQAKSILSLILKQKHSKINLGKKQKAMIEFSQPNTHKAFHVGHLRGTFIGDSLSRILELTNHKVIRANYMGDAGSHIAKWLWFYTNYCKGRKPPKKDRDKWIADIYVKAVKKVSDNPEFQKDVDIINHKLEKRDKSILHLWKETKQWSLQDFKQIYKELDIKFNYYFFESDMESEGKKIAEDLLDKKIAVIDEGATIIDLEKNNLGKWVLLRSDGTCLYSIKDIALAKIKFEKYKIKKSIYVVGAAQSLHLKQLFKTLELMNFKNAKYCYHLPFTEVRLPTGKMSSRTGENVLYSDLKKEILEKAINETKKRNPKWSKSKVNKTASAIILSAMKYSMISQDPNRIILFDPQKEISFEGDTGPYIQYTHARANSILKKARAFKPNYHFTEEIEHQIINHLSKFQETVKEAAEKYRPHLIAHYSLDLAHSFNEFYHKYPVLKAEKTVKESRLALVKATKQILKSSLQLLGIKPLEKM